jgi:hypothetical protein
MLFYIFIRGLVSNKGISALLSFQKPTSFHGYSNGSLRRPFLLGWGSGGMIMLLKNRLVSTHRQSAGAALTEMVKSS